MAHSIAMPYRNTSHVVAGSLPLATGAQAKSMKSTVSSKPKKERLGGIEDSKSAHALVDSTIRINNSEIKTSFSDIVGLDSVKQLLREMMILPVRAPIAFSGLRTPQRGLLLFGPPGNGKTMLAKATACEMSANFYYLTPSTLMSKYNGETEKVLAATVKDAIARAREGTSAVIFIDEVEALMSKRGDDGEHEVSRRLKSEILGHIDGLVELPSNVFWMAATNRPDMLDHAYIRRMPNRILIPTPSDAARLNMLDHHFGSSQDQPVQLTDAEVNHIVSLTEGFSAQNIEHLASESAMNTMRDIPFEKLMRLAPEDLREISFNDVLNALKIVKASGSEEQMAILNKWNAEYGSKSQVW